MTKNLAQFAWEQMSNTERWAFYDGEYTRRDLAERFGEMFFARGPTSPYAELSRLCETWVMGETE